MTVDNKRMTVDKIQGEGSSDKCLSALGIRIQRDVVDKIIAVLRKESDLTLYSLYAYGKRRDSINRVPICGKGTVYKIKKLYDEGKLNSYLACNDGKECSLEISEVDSNDNQAILPKKSVERDTNDAKSCLNPPPEKVDVAMLKSWGIPAKKAPEILLKWLSFHREGSHEMCKSFRNLEEDLRIRKIPFKEAEINLEAELWAREFGVDDMLEDIELRKTYRSWENIHNFKTFKKEIDVKNQPIIIARERHLDELVDRLISWKANIEEALPKDIYDTISDIRQDPLFESIMTHCFGISRAYDKILLEKAFEHYDSNSKNLQHTQSIHHLLKEIDRTLAKKTYRNQWCLNCIRK